jgi:hypothetical protein
MTWGLFEKRPHTPKNFNGKEKEGSPGQLLLSL